MSRTKFVLLFSGLLVSFLIAFPALLILENLLNNGLATAIIPTVALVSLFLMFFGAAVLDTHYRADKRFMKSEEYARMHEHELFGSEDNHKHGFRLLFAGVALFALGAALAIISGCSGQSCSGPSLTLNTMARFMLVSSFVLIPIAIIWVGLSKIRARRVPMSREI